jgi:hypothetical protein
MRKKKRRNKVELDSAKDLLALLYTLIYKAAADEQLSAYEFRISYEDLVKGSTAKKRLKGTCLSVKLDLDWDDDGSMDIFGEWDEDEQEGSYEEQ